jgi:glutamate/tyrosine decarboxylase-like PLP-dependent enzyme
MRAEDVQLPPESAARLQHRMDELADLGTLKADESSLTDTERDALNKLVKRLGNNYPLFDAHYAGQMLKSPAQIAWTAYAATMMINPNNHALDGGPGTAVLEREVVRDIATMFGYDRHLGHLAASGTIANLEALWVARELRPDTVIVSGANAHYTHERVSRVVGVKHEKIAEDNAGRMDLGALEARLREGGVGTVVATLGTTALGAVDDVAGIADLCEQYDARLHIDAAYGGFFALLAGDGVAEAPFVAASRADSIVIDPHKHGLQPYGCGCVLFADPGVGTIYAHDSSYTYFTSDDLHPGEITLECSRPGAAAAALWTTLQAIPLTREGFGAGLTRARQAALTLAKRVEADDSVELILEPDLDIICMMAKRDSAAAISKATDQAFDSLADAGWHVAKLRLDTAWLRQTHPWIAGEDETVSVIRCCLIKPEHLDIIDELGDALIGHLNP